MFTTDLVNLYNRDILKTSFYIYIFQDEKCRLMRNLSLSMKKPVRAYHKVKLSHICLFTVFSSSFVYTGVQLTTHYVKNIKVKNNLKSLEIVSLAEL